jgi:hypothetical protein
VGGGSCQSVKRKNCHPKRLQIGSFLSVVISGLKDQIIQNLAKVSDSTPGIEEKKTELGQLFPASLNSIAKKYLFLFWSQLGQNSFAENVPS